MVLDGEKKSGRQILLNLLGYAECALSVVLDSLGLMSHQLPGMEAAPEPAPCDAEGQTVWKAVS